MKRGSGTCSRYKESAEGLSDGLVGAEACSALAEGQFGLTIDCLQECQDCCKEDPCDRKCGLSAGDYGGMECKELFNKIVFWCDMDSEAQDQTCPQCKDCCDSPTPTPTPTPSPTPMPSPSPTPAVNPVCEGDNYEVLSSKYRNVNFKSSSGTE